MFFEDGSPNKDIHDALREAQRVRKQLREEEDERIASRPAAEQQTDGPDDPAPATWRRMERRRTSRGRS
jgi:hypothetical protein